MKLWQKIWWRTFFWLMAYIHITVWSAKRATNWKHQKAKSRHYLDNKSATSDNTRNSKLLTGISGWLRFVCWFTSALRLIAFNCFRLLQWTARSRPSLSQNSQHSLIFLLTATMHQNWLTIAAVIFNHFKNPTFRMSGVYMVRHNYWTPLVFYCTAFEQIDKNWQKVAEMSGKLFC